MRIVKGRFAGRNLTSPGGNVRPTPEKVRSRCVTMVESELRDAIVLDLFAGTGALGLEALSRGARGVDFVENGRAAIHSLKANVAALRATKRCRIYIQDAIPWVERLPAGAYPVAFADPPYESRKLDRIVARWREVPFADVLVVEHHRDHDFGAGVKRIEFDGPTCITILRAEPAGPARESGPRERRPPVR
jgi:16S rRNA (guanine966-N2)-methyltransferase